jgi:RND family efflux transporter MFP subunit
MKRLIPTALVVAVICGAAACSKPAPEAVESESVVPVTAAAATVGSIRSTVHATGLIAPAPAADLIVIAPEPARIAMITKAEGDPVRRGDLLVRFEIPTLTADAATKRTDVTRANARVANARAARTRAHELFERGVAARKEVEDADRDLADAEAELAAAQASSSASNTVEGRTAARATFDGVVARRYHNPGDMVEPSAGDPIMRVIDPRHLEVSASIPIGDVARIVVGAPGHVLDGNGNAVAVLKVISRPTLVDPGTAAAPVRLAFAAPANFAAGTPVQVEIDAEEHANVVLIPVSALVREGEDTAVFVVNGDKAERREVEVGLADSEHIEVRKGLKAGEQVITSGQAGLPDGAAITVTPADK